MDPPDRDTILHVLSRCEACQAGQVGTRVCVEKGHMATVASVKRSARGNNLVDPYTEEEVDARYRLMLKPGESLSMITANAVIDGEVKFAPGTVFQQPPNTKSQTLLGCLKSGIPLEDFVLGGPNATHGIGHGAGSGSRKDGPVKREREVKKDRERDADERQSKRKAPSPTTPTSGKKNVAALSASTPASAQGSSRGDKSGEAKKQLAKSGLEKAASSGVSGLNIRDYPFLDQIKGNGEAETEAPPGPRPVKREGTRSSSNIINGASARTSTEGTEPAASTSGPGLKGDSASQLEELTSAEAELKRAFDAHMKYLNEAEVAKRAEMEAFQRAGEAYLENIQRSRMATKEHGLSLRDAFHEQRKRITRLRMEEVDSERARNRLESEKREASLKAEKEALSRACEKEAADLGSAWAAMEAAAGFTAASNDGDTSNTDETKPAVVAASAAVPAKAEQQGGEQAGKEDGPKEGSSTSEKGT